MPIVIPVEVDSSSFEQGLAELESKAKKAGKSLRDEVEQGGKKAQKSMEDAGKAAEDLGDVVGLPVDKIKKLASGFGALSAPAAVAVGAVGAVAVGAGLMTAAMVGSVAAAKDLAEYLKPLSGQKGFGISTSQLASIQGANDAMKALGVIVKQLVARLGAEFAPTVERVAFLLVKFGLVALDAFNVFVDGHDVLRELARFMVGTLVDAMTPVISGLVNISQAMADLARAAGQAGLADQLDEVKLRWNAFKDAIADRAVDSLVGSFDRLDGATGDYDARARKLVGSMKTLGATVKAVKDTLADSVKVMDEDNALTAKASALVDQLTASAHKSYEERLTGEDAVKAALEDQLTTLVQVYQQAVQNATSDQQRLAANVAFEEARAEAILSAEQKIQAAQLQTSQQAVQDALDAAQKTRDAWTNATSDLEGGLAGIVSLIGGPIAGAIAGFILNFSDSVSSLISDLKSLPDTAKAIPGALADIVQTALVQVVPALLHAVPKIVENLLAAVPDIIQSLVDAIPLIVVAFVESIPTLIDAVIQGLPGIIIAIVGLIPLLLANLVGEVRVLAKDAIAWITGKGVVEVVQAFYAKLVEGWKDFVARIVDTFKGIFGGGKENKVHADAPGVQRAGPQGSRVDLSAGDYYLAGRNPQALLDQALRGLGTPAPQNPVMGSQINFAYQHRAFDGFFVRHATLGGQTTNLFKTFRNADARGHR